MKFDYGILLTYWPIILKGIGLTIALSALTIVIAPIIGVGVALGRSSRSRLVRALALGYVEIGRNLPFMVILFLLFFGLPAYGIRLPEFVVGLTALSLYAAAYFAEIIRAAILSVPKGQMESARAVGMSRWQALRHVVFPQMMGYFLPPATNQAIMVVKESSILSTITVIELTMSGQIIQGYTYSPIEVFAMVSVAYWVICAAVTRAGVKLEASLQPFRRGRTAPLVVLAREADRA